MSLQACNNLERESPAVRTISAQAQLPRRICFVGTTRVANPLDATAEKKFRALSTLGDVSVISFSADGRFHVFRQHAQFWLFPDIRPAALRYLLVYAWGTALAVREVLRGTTVLVAQSPHEGLAAALAKKLTRLLGYSPRLVVESHGDFEVALFMQRRVRCPGLVKTLIGFVARFSGRQADALRAISQSTAMQLQRLAPGKPLVVFPAWTDLETFLAVGPSTAQRQPLILYAGAIIPLKGLHHLIRSFSVIVTKFPQVRLEIVGSVGNTSYADELRRAVTDLQLSERVAFVPALSQPELARRMAGASVFVLPSHSEGLGRVLFEAMATGTPVVASAVGGIPEIVQHGVNGFIVAPGDEAALTRAVLELLSNPEHARALGDRGRQMANEIFSTAKYVEGYRTAFRLAGDMPCMREPADPRAMH